MRFRGVVLAIAAIALGIGFSARVADAEQPNWRVNGKFLAAGKSAVFHPNGNLYYEFDRAGEPARFRLECPTLFREATLERHGGKAEITALTGECLQLAPPPGADWRYIINKQPQVLSVTPLEGTAAGGKCSPEACDVLLANGPLSVTLERFSDGSKCTFEGRLEGLFNNGTATARFPASALAGTKLSSTGCEEPGITGGIGFVGESDKRTLEIEFEKGNPGLGRCVAVAKGTGFYTSSTCLVEDTTADSNFEWEGGPGTNSVFTSKGGVATLESVKKEKITCQAETDSGTYIGELEGNSRTVFTGCESVSAKVSCQSVGKAGEIETEELRSSYGIIKAPSGVGTLIEPKPPGTELAKFECGGGGSGLGPAVIVKGSLIAATTVVDKMEPTAIQKFSEAKGIQKPLSFEGEATKHFEESSVGGGPFEQAGQLLTITITNSSPLEIRAHAPSSSP